MKRLYEEFVVPVATRQTRGAWYAGRRLVSIDGSTLDVADTRENERAFGRPGASRGRAGFPKIRHLVACFEQRVGNYHAEGYFPTRTFPPTHVSASVTQPSGWNANTIKTVWQTVAYPNGPPVAALTAGVAGPNEVRAFDFCAWQAVVNGGVPPYQYQWSGAFSGTSSFVSGWLTSPATLGLQVTSSDQQQVMTSFPISVNSGAPACTL